MAEPRSQLPQAVSPVVMDPGFRRDDSDSWFPIHAFDAFLNRACHESRHLPYLHTFASKPVAASQLADAIVSNLNGH